LYIHSYNLIILNNIIYILRFYKTRTKPHPVIHRMWKTSLVVTSYKETFRNFVKKYMHSTLVLLYQGVFL